MKKFCSSAVMQCCSFGLVITPEGLISITAGATHGKKEAA
jgi:hypothetical protein